MRQKRTLLTLTVYTIRKRENIEYFSLVIEIFKVIFRQIAYIHAPEDMFRVFPRPVRSAPYRAAFCNTPPSALPALAPASSRKVPGAPCTRSIRSPSQTPPRAPESWHSAPTSPHAPRANCIRRQKHSGDRAADFPEPAHTAPERGCQPGGRLPVKPVHVLKRQKNSLRTAVTLLK